MVGNFFLFGKVWKIMVAFPGLYSARVLMYETFNLWLKGEFINIISEFLQWSWAKLYSRCYSANNFCNFFIWDNFWMEKYHVLELIGEGSFGRVFKGRLKHSGLVCDCHFPLIFPNALVLLSSSDNLGSYWQNQQLGREELPAHQHLQKELDGWGNHLENLYMSNIRLYRFPW